jgi:hypothetical protein
MPSIGEATIAAAILKQPLPTSASSPALASAAPAVAADRYGGVVAHTAAWTAA